MHYIGKMKMPINEFYCKLANGHLYWFDWFLRSL